MIASGFKSAWEPKCITIFTLYNNVTFLFLSAYSAQLRYVTLATEIAQPAQPKQMELLQPTSTQISAVQDYREKHRSSPFFNHLSAISESIPALGWVCVAMKPGQNV